MLPGTRNQVLRRTQKRPFKMQATESLPSEGAAGTVKVRWPAWPGAGR